MSNPEVRTVVFRNCRDREVEAIRRTNKCTETYIEFFGLSVPARFSPVSSRTLSKREGKCRNSLSLISIIRGKDRSLPLPVLEPPFSLSSCYESLRKSRVLEAAKVSLKALPLATDKTAEETLLISFLRKLARNFCRDRPSYWASLLRKDRHRSKSLRKVLAKRISSHFFSPLLLCIKKMLLQMCLYILNMSFLFFYIYICYQTHPQRTQTCWKLKLIEKYKFMIELQFSNKIIHLFFFCVFLFKLTSTVTFISQWSLRH